MRLISSNYGYRLSSYTSWAEMESVCISMSVSFPTVRYRTAVKSNPACGVAENFERIKSFRSSDHDLHRGKQNKTKEASLNRLILML
jgi:hypothetical protein